MGAGFLRFERTGAYCEGILYAANRSGPWLDYQDHSGLPGDLPPVVGRLGIEGNPEWANGSTSWFIVFIGLYQLLFLHHSMAEVRLISVFINPSTMEEAKRASAIVSDFTTASAQARAKWNRKM